MGKVEKKIQYLSTEEALEVCNTEGYPIVQGTLQMWYHKYKLGKKIAGRLRYDKAKLLSILQGEK